MLEQIRYSNVLALRSVQFNEIQQWFVDFQKKSKCFELPPDNAELLGIYLDDLLIGYFVLVGYSDGDLEINQGYLKPVARHRALSYESMKLLQAKATQVGYKKIILKASRSLKAYTRFMSNLGFKPTAIIFSKEV